MFDYAGYADRFAQTLVHLVGVRVRREAKKNARVDTRENQNAIRLDRVDRTMVEVSANTPWAAAQEFGHPNYPSIDRPPGEAKSGSGGPYTFHPYMRPAAETAVKEIRDDVKTAEQIVRNGGAQT